MLGRGKRILLKKKPKISQTDKSQQRQQQLSSSLINFIVSFSLLSFYIISHPKKLWLSRQMQIQLRFFSFFILLFSLQLILANHHHLILLLISLQSQHWRRAKKVICLNMRYKWEKEKDRECARQIVSEWRGRGRRVEVKLKWHFPSLFLFLFLACTGTSLSNSLILNIFSAGNEIWQIVKFRALCSPTLNELLQKRKKKLIGL